MSQSDLSSLINALEHRLRVGRCSTPEYQRRRKLAHRLDRAIIDRSADPDALKKLGRMLKDARRSRGDGLGDAFDRATLGALKCHADNRLRALARGRSDGQRSRGPTFDPARIPTDRLEAIAQRCGDLEKVDRARTELRARRLEEARK